MYEDFLKSVELLRSMDHYERSKLANVIKERNFKPGERIINQGDEGDTFYIIISGEAYATKKGDNGSDEKEVMKYRAGQYFGELALLKNEPRAASVLAKT